MKSVPSVYCMTLVLCVSSTVSAAMPEWNTYQGNERHTGYVPISLNIGEMHHLWTQTYSASLNPVAIGGGKIFASETGRFSPGRGLFAIQSQTGSNSWTYPDFGRVNSINPPAYANGRVYLQTGKESSSGIPPYLYAFDATSGGLAFRSQFSAQWESYYAPTVYQGDVYMNGGYSGGAYRYDGDDGNREWFAGLPQYDDWTPAVDDQYVYAYVGEYSPGLYVLNRTTGTREFTISDPQFDWNGWSMNLAPVLTDDGDVIAIHDGRLIRFDVDGRTIDWEMQRSFSGQPTVAGNVIYAIDSSTLTAWDVSTGDYLWGWTPSGGERVVGNLIATDTHILAQSTSSTFAVNLATGVEDWGFNASGSIALGDGVLAIVDGPSLHAFSVTAVPEPSTLCLLLTGIAICGLMNRRRITRVLSLRAHGDH